MRRLRPGDRWGAASAVCLVAGAILLLVAWYDVSGTNQLYEQLPYLVSAGFSGLALVMLGCALLVAGRYDRVERRLARLVDALTDPADRGVAEPAPGTAVTPAAGEPDSEGADATADAARVVVPNGTTYHRPACPLVQGKPTTEVTGKAVADSGLSACPVCDPDAADDPAGPLAPERA